MKHLSKISSLLFLFLCSHSLPGQSPQVGAFYFDGWTQKQWDNYKNLNFQGGAYNDALVLEYSDREPAYGWVTSTPKGMEEQIKDALESGLDFLVFDWYYCKGTGYKDCFLNNALNLFMENTQNELKFASMITNDAYDIGPNEWEETKAQLKVQFQHSAYLRINNRPVVYIYLGAKMIDTFGGIRKFKKELKEFKNECRESGLGEPLIGMANIVEEYSLRRLRFADFLFNYNQPVLVLHNDTEPVQGNKYDIDDMIKSEFDYWFYLQGEALNKIFVPTITSGWDKRPWDKSTRVIYTRPTRDYIKKAVNKAIEFNELYNENSLGGMILIYAWNEYAEGGYISPMKNGEFIGMGIKDAKYEKH